MRRYRELLAVPGVRRLVAALVGGRLATSMLNLALLVAATQAYGYAEAGLLLMVFAVCNALAGPVRGRLADRRSPRRVMLALLAGHAVAFAGVPVALATGSGVAVLAVAMAALGVTVPPSGPVVRGLWPSLVPADRLPAAYAFDAGLNTATFVAGPMVAGALLLALPPAVVIALMGAVKLAGDLMVAVAPALSARTPQPAAAGGRWLARVLGPLVNGRVRLHLLMMGLDTFCFGCLEVTAVAATSGQGSAGVFTSLLALGAMISGVTYGSRTWPGSARAQLVVLHTLGAALLAGGVAGASNLVLLGAVFAGYGLVNGSVETLKQVLAGEASSPGQRIEVFSWVFSVMWAGLGIGTFVAGRLAELGGTTATLPAAATAQLVIALVAVLSVSGLRRPATSAGR